VTEVFTVTIIPIDGRVDMFDLNRKIARHDRQVGHKPDYHFHGGCFGCTQQDKHGLEMCKKCDNMGAGGTLDYNNLGPSKEDWAILMFRFEKRNKY